MYFPLTPEEQSYREPLKARIEEITEELVVLNRQLKTLTPELELLKHASKVHHREKVNRVKARVAHLQMMAALQALSDDPTDRAAEWNVVCRQLANFLYDITSPQDWTGYASQELKNAKTKTYSKEHFFSRQRGGDFIASECLRKGMKFKRFYDLIKRFRLFHRTTSEENSRLLSRQRKPGHILGWRKDYKACNIVIEKPEKQKQRSFWLTPSLERKYAEIAPLYGPLKEEFDKTFTKKRTLKDERVLLNKTLKKRGTMYQRARKIGLKHAGELPFHMWFDDLTEKGTSSEILLNTISVEGDESLV